MILACAQQPPLARAGVVQDRALGLHGEVEGAPGCGGLHRHLLGVAFPGHFGCLDIQLRGVPRVVCGGDGNLVHAVRAVGLIGQGDH